MNVYRVDMENEQEKYKVAYVRAENFASAEARVRTKYPDHNITSISLEGLFID